MLEAGVRRVRPRHRPPQVLLSSNDDDDEDDEGKNEEGACASCDVVDPPYLPYATDLLFARFHPYRIRSSTLVLVCRWVGIPSLHRGDGGVRLYYVGTWDV